MTKRHLAATGDLAAQLVGIGAALSSAHDQRVDADRVVRFAARVLPSSRHCGVTLIRGGHRPRTMASSDALPEQVDVLQYDIGEGPCFEAATDGVELSGCLATDQRWPAFGPQCVEHTGVQSMLSVRLCVTGRDFAALNFYSQERGAFGEEDVDVATLLAPYASLAVEHALRVQDTSNFEAALSSSRQIGTAIGIIMARRLVTSEEAFELLRGVSQDLNRKLREVAAQVEETGELPASGRATPLSVGHARLSREGSQPVVR
ncbi:GAF and ANTAR domain-containing protein [Phycicoccus ginsengisoli]